MEMHVLEAKVCEATLCGSRAARRQMEVNSVEVKVFLATCPGEGLRGRKWTVSEGCEATSGGEQR